MALPRGQSLKHGFTQWAEFEGWVADQQQQVVHVETLRKTQWHFLAVTTVTTDSFVLGYQRLGHPENINIIKCFHCTKEKKAFMWGS